MTLFIELHVYIYIVYAHFLYIPFRNYMYFRFTNHSGRCDWGGVLSKMTLPIQRSFLDSIKWSWVLFIALFFCGFSDIFSLVFLSLSHNHTVFGIHNHVRRIYLEFRVFSSWITCAYLHIHIATSYHSSKQLVSFKVGILFGCNLVSTVSDCCTDITSISLNMKITLFIYFWVIHM